MNNKRSTQTLSDALIAYDAGDAERQQRWEAARTNADALAAQAEDAAALRKVQEVFADLTSDRNSRESALLVDIGFMRRIAALGEV